MWKQFAWLWENMDAPFRRRHIVALCICVFTCLLLVNPALSQRLINSTKYVARHKYKMLLALVLSALASVASLYIPKITQWVLDEAVPNQNAAMTGRMALLFVGVISLCVVFTVVRSRMMAHMSQRIIYDIRSDLFAHLQKLPFSYYDGRPRWIKSPST